MTGASTFMASLERSGVNDIHRLALFLSHHPGVLEGGRRAVLRLEAEDDLHLRELLARMYGYWRFDAGDQVAWLDFGIGARVEIDARSVVWAEGADTALAIVLQERSNW